MMDQPIKSDNKFAQADLSLKKGLASFDGFYDLVLQYGVRAVLREMRCLDLPAARILANFWMPGKMFWNRHPLSWHHSFSAIWHLNQTHRYSDWCRVRRHGVVSPG